MKSKKTLKDREYSELKDLFIDKNQIKPKKIFRKLPSRYMDIRELNSIKPSNYYDTYLTVFDELDKLK